MIQDFKAIYNEVVNRILPGLPKELSYHNTRHTLDVLNESQRIARKEGVHSKEDLFLLKTAALFHDIGYIHTNEGHEKISCEIARKELPVFGLNEKQLGIICSMIIATEIPQSPKNKLEEIICDADLDYLGRSDYFEIANYLFEEMKQLGLLKDEREWNRIQIEFLKAHHYFTTSSKKLRESKKQEHLSILEKLFN